MASQADQRDRLTLIDKGSLVDTLWHAVDGATGNLAAVPGLVKQVLTTGAWREREHRGRVFRHDRFIDFITAKPMAGCGWPPEKVEALIKEDAETLTLWRKAVTLEPSLHHAHDNIISTSQGTSRSYTLSRLSREAPALHAAVCAGELSANAAAIEAGFRKKPTPYEQIQKLIPKLSKAEKAALRRALDEA